MVNGSVTNYLKPQGRCSDAENYVCWQEGDKLHESRIDLSFMGHELTSDKERAVRAVVNLLQCKPRASNQSPPVSAFHRYHWFGVKLFPVGCAQDSRRVPEKREKCVIWIWLIIIIIIIKHVLIKVTLSCQRHCRGTAQSLTSKKRTEKR